MSDLIYRSQRCTDPTLAAINDNRHYLLVSELVTSYMIHLSQVVGIKLLDF